MKSTSLSPKSGFFLGIKYELKPSTINAQDLDQQQRDMLLGWYGEHYPTLKEKLVNGAEIEDYTNEELLGISEWKKDVDFRAEYIKFLAEHSMSFERKVPEDYWRRDDVPFGAVKEAWDFFTESRVG